MGDAAKNMAKDAKDGAAAFVDERPALANAVDKGRSAVKTGAATVDSKLEETGIKGAAIAAKDWTGGKLDDATGVPMYDAVQVHLDEQRRFNDLVATKLQEALDEIDRLRQRVDALEVEAKR